MRETVPIGFAHRGASADAPENTLAAFELALRLGATGLESDTWVTRDGVAVLDHDGKAPDGTPFAELERAALPVHVPSLAELYETCGSDFELSLDVKDGRAEAVVAAARDQGAESRLWLCHHNWKVVAAWRELSPTAKLVDSTNAAHMRTPPEPRARRMRELGIDAINLHESQWTSELVAAFAAAGRHVLAWDTQDAARLQRAFSLGVDGVFCDHVARMMAEIDARTR